jgi:hypothetical protein
MRRSGPPIQVKVYSEPEEKFQRAVQVSLVGSREWEQREVAACIFHTSRKCRQSVQSSAFSPTLFVGEKVDEVRMRGRLT